MSPFLRSLSVAALAFGLFIPDFCPPGHAAPLEEPSLRLKKSATKGITRVALTLDACGGAIDNRILDALINERISATIFVTSRWLKRNAEAFARMRAHPDLFEIENHGARHIPAIDAPMRIYGIQAAGSPAAVAREITMGVDAIALAEGGQARWFRGATARYSTTAIAQINDLGYRIAGYSLNGDDGARLSAKEAEKRIAAAQDGDVIIAHINQPARKAGAGVVKGILELKARGVVFIRLEDDDDKEEAEKAE